MELYDVETRRLAAEARVKLLRRAAARRPRPHGRRLRQRLGFGIAAVGLRIAEERPLPSGA